MCIPELPRGRRIFNIELGHESTAHGDLGRERRRRLHYRAGAHLPCRTIGGTSRTALIDAITDHKTHVALTEMLLRLIEHGRIKILAKPHNRRPQQATAGFAVWQLLYWNASRLGLRSVWRGLLAQRTGVQNTDFVIRGTLAAQGLADGTIPVDRLLAALGAAYSVKRAVQTQYILRAGALVQIVHVLRNDAEFTRVLGTEALEVGKSAMRL